MNALGVLAWEPEESKEQKGRYNLNYYLVWVRKWLEGRWLEHRTMEISETGLFAYFNLWRNNEFEVQWKSIYPKQYQCILLRKPYQIHFHIEDQEIQADNRSRNYWVDQCRFHYADMDHPCSRWCL